MKNIIFPSSPESRNKVCFFWEKEAQIAADVGFNISIVSDHCLPGPVGIKGLNSETDEYIYRGWIIKPNQYELMVQAANKPLLNSYENYMASYHFPTWYAQLHNETPHSLIFTADEVVKLGLSEIAQQVAQQTGSKPLMIKDFLKSRKHEWFDACFIKDASDVNESIRVMSNFFELQGRDFYGGLVFRDFLKLKQAGIHPKSGMPLPLEFRTFFLKQKPMITTVYWTDDIKYPDNVEMPPQAWLEEVGRKMISPFVALDIAQDENDKWWVIEVNDGGSAGYAQSVDSKEFYTSLLKG